MPERLFLDLLTPSEILAILTGVLVLITAYYAWQTRQTVDELKRARGVAVLPKLAISIRTLSAGIGWIRITNVGPGPALDISATPMPAPNAAMRAERTGFSASIGTRRLPAVTPYLTPYRADDGGPRQTD